MALWEGEVCRDCAVTVNPKWSEQQFGEAGARIQPDLCTFGFTNCKKLVPPVTEATPWGFGYYLCCNCSLKDGWGDENYADFGCMHCKDRKKRSRASSRIKTAILPTQAESPTDAAHFSSRFD